jgi:uncharacterized membrane protein YfcA
VPRPSPYFSRPVYEGLPWFYISCGIAALVVSYLLAARALASLLVGLVGLLVLLGGIVVLLRRRNYRDLRSQYAGAEALTPKDPPQP